jgi:hypothetical protein
MVAFDAFDYVNPFESVSQSEEVFLKVSTNNCSIEAFDHPHFVLIIERNLSFFQELLHSCINEPTFFIHNDVDWFVNDAMKMFSNAMMIELRCFIFFKGSIHASDSC